MQLSTPTSPDPNLLTLLFPSPVSSGVATPDAPVALGAIVDFETLLGSPVAPAMALPAVAVPGGVAPAMPATSDAPSPLIAPAFVSPETIPVIAPGGTPPTPTPRAWPFVAIRPVNLSVTAAPAIEITSGDTAVEAEDGQVVATAVSPARIVMPKIPEGEPRPVGHRDCDDEREKLVLPDAVPLIVPVEITPVALAVGLPEPQRCAVEPDLACAAEENGRAETPMSIGSSPRNFPLVAPVIGRNPKPASVAVSVAPEFESTSVAPEPKVPFRFARPTAVAFQPDLADVDTPVSTASSPQVALPSPADTATNPETMPAIPAKPTATFSRSESILAPLVADSATPVATQEVEATSPVATTPALSPAEVSTDRRVDDAAIAPEQAAEFAVNFEANAAENSRRGIARPRNFVSATEKQLTSRTPNLGTTVAEPATAMPPASTLPRPPHAAFESASLLVDRVEGAGLVAPDAATDVSPAPEATANTAHRAVEAVLNAAQRFSASDRHTVNLQFSVGGTDLNVRVELRADEVRATFRTDSPELRAALSHEWQAAAAQGDRSVRLAEPVFTGNNSSGFSASSGDHASQQQHRQSSARADEQFAFATFRTGAKPDAAPAANSSVTPRLPLSTALHLHTLA